MPAPYLLKIIARDTVCCMLLIITEKLHTFLRVTCMHIGTVTAIDMT